MIRGENVHKEAASGLCGGPFSMFSLVQAFELPFSFALAFSCGGWCGLLS